MIIFEESLEWRGQEKERLFIEKADLWLAGKTPMKEDYWRSLIGLFPANQGSAFSDKSPLLFLRPPFWWFF